MGGLCGVLGFALIRGPWPIEATSDRGEAHRVQVRGWRASTEAAARTVERLAAGLTINGAAPDLVAPVLAGPDLAAPAPVADPGRSGPGGASQPLEGAVVAEDAGTAPTRRPGRWASLVLLVVSMVLVALVQLGPRWLWEQDCPTPGLLSGAVTTRALPATLVAAGPLSVDEAVFGKYGTDGRRSAIDTGTFPAAHHEDWLTGEDVTLLRELTFRTRQHALDYAAVDAETICAFVAATFTPYGVPGAAGVRQPWRHGPPGWWAGVVVDRTYVRAYVRSHAADHGPTLVTDALERAVLDPS